MNAQPPARPPAPWLEAGITAFALFQAATPLLGAWLHSPLDRLGWVALLIWGAPLFFQREPAAGAPGQGWLLGAALLATLLGTLADLNALSYAGLALALMAWRAVHWPHLLWLAAAPAWMPALGWLLHNFLGAPAILAVRLLLAAAGVFLFFLARKHRPQS